MLGFGHNTDFVEIKSKDQVISLYNIDSQQAEVKEPKDEASSKRFNIVKLFNSTVSNYSFRNFKS